LSGLGSFPKERPGRAVLFLAGFGSDCPVRRRGGQSHPDLNVADKHGATGVAVIGRPT